MQISKEQMEAFKKLHKEKYGQELSDKEAYESASNLLGFMKTLIKIDTRERRYRKKLVEENPGGYHLPEGKTYTCIVCHSYITGKDGWYDEWGKKCIPCQDAIRSGVLPKYVCTNRNSFYLMWELKDKLNLHHSTVRKMVRNGELKARVVMKNGKPWEYVFLKKENFNIK